MAFNIGSRRNSKEDDNYIVPGFVAYLNGYLDHKPTEFVEVEPGIEYPEDMVHDLMPTAADLVVVDSLNDETEAGQPPETSVSLKPYTNEHGLVLVDLPENVNNTLLVEDNAEVRRRTLNFSAGFVATRGIKRAAAAIQTGSAKSAEFAGDKLRGLSASVTSHIMRTSERLSDIELSPRQKKMAIAVGGLALATAGALAAHRLGLHLKGSNSVDHNTFSHSPTKSVEAVHHVVSPAKDVVKPYSLKVSHAAIKTAVHAKPAIHMESVVRINNGEGYTQVLQKIFPNHSPSAYLDAYTEGVKQFGPNFIKGVHHYRMANGDWGLSGSGQAHLNPVASHFFSSYFKNHR